METKQISPLNQYHWIICTVNTTGPQSVVAILEGRCNCLESAVKEVQREIENLCDGDRVTQITIV